MRIKTRRTPLFLAAVVAALLSTVAMAADAPKRVLILPFNVHSESDLSFLQKGVTDMLSTRLTLAGKAVPIPKEDARYAIENMPRPIGEKAAILLGASLGADYVVLGSLTVFGDSISTDARFLDVGQQKPVVTFNQFGREHGDVIAQVNQFAGQVGEEIFGIQSRYVPAARPAASPPAVGAPPQPAQQGPATPQTHPETVFAQDFGGGGGIMTTLGGEPASSGRLRLPAWKSRSFAFQIKGMAVGDVDGDGQQEVVFIDDQTVHIYRLSQGKFAKIAVVEGDINDSYIAVDAADINGNGLSEIFVTCLYENSKRLRSFVLEKTGADFIPIVENEGYYYRVLMDPNRGEILFGQRQGVKDIFGRKVYEMQWSGGNFEPTTPRNLPKNVNIFGFAFGDVMNNGGEMIVAMDKKDHLGLFQPSGIEEWLSEVPYGGSAIYLEPPSQSGSKSGRVHGDSYAEKRTYLPQRIFIKDLDKDGKNEVLSVQNKDAGGRFLSRARLFRSGHIECLQWETLGLYEKWRIRKVSGHISDFAIADFDNDGDAEIVFAVVVKEDTGVSDGRSYIAGQELQ